MCIQIREQDLSCRRSQIKLNIILNKKLSMNESIGSDIDVQQISRAPKDSENLNSLEESRELNLPS